MDVRRSASYLCGFPGYGLNSVLTCPRVSADVVAKRTSIRSINHPCSQVSIPADRAIVTHQQNLMDRKGMFTVFTITVVNFM